ncbi:hypothetical protein PHYBLDRAFT_163330 [Phycomyces blakesleeanus NRRL 1555(-)]|uniref:Uncharacterized protein n=1 Tax=Phycomyces blakesleeanus (strain ATCC 8743b / DSM 1359 / FGSC 10004 / NBRC 33097 / NRRL 1555) TaxID=763407 RepID=A0A163B4C0_PHYB8|nr:hypothetical protein PHYBLDRAFT_163330 [Phycomyces blakesleeanus NRRL 1555(-)]OAD78211.1 hypothetical protein PHYBLDRAFT_163330 [Phycomyces blakesleeanus NRRL 1555(-)]|eukprot:XP_018296251.1 hypothetical protein PHYBLDRAFT_163330 [Phycomyces blakesleeanus NRRL 1555(-)]
MCVEPKRVNTGLGMMLDTRFLKSIRYCLKLVKLYINYTGYYRVGCSVPWLVNRPKDNEWRKSALMCYLNLKYKLFFLVSELVAINIQHKINTKFAMSIKSPSVKSGDSFSNIYTSRMRFDMVSY